MTHTDRLDRALHARRRVSAAGVRSRDASDKALRHLLETGIHAGSQLEAAQAVASCAAGTLHFPVSCAFLVGEHGTISMVSVSGTTASRTAALRALLIGEVATKIPVWRRAFSSAAAPDLIGDTRAPGAVRPGGLASTLELRALVGIPLHSPEGPLGFAVAGDTAPHHRWSPAERAALTELTLAGSIIVDNARLRALERHDATHDPLTGLLNRRGFLDRFEQTLSATLVGAHQVAVLVMDIDGLKEVNDNLGHHCGDELLVEFARRLQASFRDGDMVGRLGGDEFAAVLSGDTSSHAIAAVVDRIRLNLGHPITLAGHPTLLRASIGVAVSGHPDETVDELLSRADRAMYTAKRGRPAATDDPGDGGRL
jgi:diguanylate cyclase (GGDEF)-like protein